MSKLSQLLSTHVIAFTLLLCAALLEVLGDSCFQSAIHRSSGVGRVGWLVLGVSLFALYGLFVNLPRWDFGRLLGVYVVFFFLAAQLVARLRSNQPMTLPLQVGGALIVAGGLVVSFWEN